MQAERDPYFDRPEVSNSDLSWLEEYWQPEDLVYDKHKAYRFGTLLDAMITEQEKINYFKLTCAGEQYTKAEFELAASMKREYQKDQLCSILTKHSEMQKVIVVPRFRIQYYRYVFYMDVRCKFDLYAKQTLGMTGDIKSTTATTLEQFIQACEYFGYWRQRAWYMDLAEVDKDMLIGISKVNKKVFKIPIVRGDAYYTTGKEQYQELAWKWHCLFGDVSNTEVVPMNHLKLAV